MNTTTNSSIWTGINNISFSTTQKTALIAVLLVIATIVTYQLTGKYIFLTGAVIVSMYMALNTGANDVANNIGPAVGSGALSLTAALLIAGVFEAGGAIIAGGDVVSTIKKGIIDPNGFINVEEFKFAMGASLGAAALWLNFATWKGLPVSTTHSIVGAITGAGIAGAGFSIVNWSQMFYIVLSWGLSPLIGGIITFIFLFCIKKFILYKEDVNTAAKKGLPVLISIMAWVFSAYIVLKGLKKVWENLSPYIPFVEVSSKPSTITAITIGLVFAIITYLIVKPIIKKVADKTDDVNKIFTIPLIFSACLLCFAHGANDVANAIGPLAAIVDAVNTGEISGKASIPLWIMLIGAGGIAIGLWTFGGKIIKKVGFEITEMTHARAFSVAMGSAITVIIASHFKLPVSSTHITLGGVFTVAYFPAIIGLINRTFFVILEPHGQAEKTKFYENRLEVERKKEKVKKHTATIAKCDSNIFNLDESITSLKEKIQVLKASEDFEKALEIEETLNSKLENLNKANISKYNAEEKLRKAKKKQSKTEKTGKKLRENVKKIVASWVITVPASATGSGIFFLILKQIAFLNP